MTGLAGAPIQYVVAGAAFLIPHLVLPPASITALVTALGGTTEVIGAYNCTQGITLSSGAVTSWADVTSSGPTLSQATQAKMPSVAADGALVTAASANQNLLSAATAAFVLTGTLGIIYVGALYGGAGTPYAVALTDSGSPTTFLGIEGASATYRGKSGASLTEINSTTPTGTTPRVVGVATNTVPQVLVQIPNQVQHFNAEATANGSNSPTLCLGGYFGANGNANQSCYGLFILTRVPTLSDLQTVAAAYPMVGVA